MSSPEDRTYKLYLEANEKLTRISDEYYHMQKESYETNKIYPNLHEKLQELNSAHADFLLKAAKFAGSSRI